MRQMELSEKTTIPLGALLSFMAIFGSLGVGSILWAANQTADLAQAKKELTVHAKLLNRLDHGMVRVQIKLGIDVPRDDNAE